MFALLLIACILFDTSGTEDRIRQLTDEDHDGSSIDGGDCDDVDASVYLGAAEVCDGKDNDCDHAVDEDGGGQRWCLDEDGDGHGDPSTLSNGCSTPTTAVLVCDDCDDRSRAISPDAVEVCNDKDDDCDGVTDPATSADVTIWFQDSDADGYGDSARTTAACDQPDGFAARADDCDDTMAGVFPGALELCNDGLDNDCDGTPNGCGLAGDHLVQPGEGEEGYYAPPAGDDAVAFAEFVYLADLRGDGIARPIVQASRYDLSDNYNGGALFFYDAPPNGASSWDDSDRVYFGSTGMLLGLTSPPILYDPEQDGSSVLLVGAAGPADGFPPAGSLLSISGPPSGPTQATVADVLLSGLHELDYFGATFQYAGAMYGSADALVVSAPDDSEIAYAAGVVYILSPFDGGTETPIARVSASAYGAELGAELPPLADLDGDGVDDLILGSRAWESADAGSWVFQGPLFGSLTLEDADLSLLDPTEYDLGRSILAVDDLLGDGLPALALSSQRADLEGRIYVLPGATTGVHTPDSVASVRLTLVYSGPLGDLEQGDLNGDAAQDLLAGADSYDDPDRGTEGGAIFLLNGPLPYTGAVAMDDVADAAWFGVLPRSYVGRSIATGDANNDGFDDLFFNGLNSQDPEEAELSAWFYYGEGI